MRDLQSVDSAKASRSRKVRAGSGKQTVRESLTG
jgi:hypothetical protein